MQQLTEAHLSFGTISNNKNPNNNVVYHCSRMDWTETQLSMMHKGHNNLNDVSMRLDAKVPKILTMINQNSQYYLNSMNKMEE